MTRHSDKINTHDEVAWHPNLLSTLNIARNNTKSKMTSHIAPFILSSFRILLTTPIILLCSTIITAALDWESLNAVLTDSILHGPVLDTDYQACDLFTDANTKSNSLHGICMQTYDCSHQFCNPLQFGFNLPLYTLDARSESDISTALQFASANNIKVSVKTTGYSLQGSSTSRDSLMIWMRNFPKDNQIKINFQGEIFIKCL